MKNKMKILITFLFLALTFVSCLKDDVGEYWPDDLAGKMYATVVKSAAPQQLALQPVPGDVPFEFLVNIATDALPTEDITLTFKIDPAAVTEYNTNYKKNFKPYPNVSMTTQTLVIAKVTRNGMAKGKVWGAEKLNACDDYMAGITIESAVTSSGKVIPVGGNMKSYLLALPIANPYAGDYRCVGYRIRPGNPTEPVDAVEPFWTVNCKTVQKSGFGNYFAYDVKIEMTTNTVVVGGTTCYKVIATPVDPSSGASVGGMFDVWTGDPTLKPADLTINYYNPVTKVFILNCYYNSSAGNRIMYETLTRL
jgi:hypothetical protein